MTSIKWGITLGIIAAVISITLGVIFGVALFYVIIRALVFFFIFFAIGAGLRVILDNYFPELTYIDDGSEASINFDQQPEPGSKINITLGGEGEYAVPEMFKDSGDQQELGNIEDLISGHFKVQTVVDNTPDNTSFGAPSGGDETASAAPQRGFEGIDLTTEDDYNIGSDSFNAGPQEFVSFQTSEPEPEPSRSAAVEKPVFTPVFGGDSDDLGALPDLGSMATVFSTGSETAEATAMPHLGDEADSSQMQYNKGNKPQPLEGDFDPQELAQGIRTVLNKDQGR